jgi:tetratricopeptide (TPR) repeat protein
VRAYVAGRLCRRRAEHDRAFLWYERAIRLARRAQVAGEAGAEIDFANAHLGYGNTYVDLDQYTRAEPHFWKAIRAAKRSGRRSLAGSGYHNLLATSAILERWDAAFNCARFAVALYKPGHPRFPVLATDVATLLNRLGYYSSAIPVLEKTLPFLVNQPERILALASLAEAAGAIRDRVRFERAAEHVVRSAQNQDEMSASSLYWVAEGALCFGETDRATAWATSAIEVAQSRQNPVIVELASRLLTRIANGEDGRRDRVPPEGGSVDEICSLVLRKLKKQPPPLPAAPPPEQYPSL